MRQFGDPPDIHSTMKQPSPPLLRLSLLGSPVITREHTLLTELTIGKAQALLYYLAVTGRPHTRTTLAALLWPETSDAQARKNLRNLLLHVRPLLTDYLVIEYDTLAFNRQSAYWLDVEVLCATQAASQADDNLEPFRQAMSLYRGDFLDDFFIPNAPAFEEWMLMEREHLRELAINGLTRLAQVHHQRREYAAGLEATRRLLALDPWRETAHQQQMRLLALNGQRGAALTQYELCRRLLADEFATTPMSETTALYEQIKADLLPVERASITMATPPAPRVADAALAPTLGAGGVPTNLRPSLAPLVGRARELAQIQARLVDPACRLLTITGMSGVGKTEVATAAVADLLTTGRTANFPDGVYFIGLGDLAQRCGENTVPVSLTSAIARAVVGHPAGNGKAEEVPQWLQNRRLLLVLDEFDPTLHRADELLALLQGAPGLRLLVTARLRLHLKAEWLMELHGLPILAEVDAQGCWQGAVALFAQRARQINPEFQLDAGVLPHVLHICRLVEGLPLGLILAAGWVRLLSCAAIAQEIAQDYDFLTTSLCDLPERHRTLRSVFDQSWHLLDAGERSALLRLASLPGAFTRTAVQQMGLATPLLLASLVDKTFLRLVGRDGYELCHWVRHYLRAQSQASTGVTSERNVAEEKRFFSPAAGLQQHWLPM
jgi:DNA-binding SARP family transcriptional activator/predicted ATPase